MSTVRPSSPGIACRQPESTRSRNMDRIARGHNAADARDILDGPKAQRPCPLSTVDQRSTARSVTVTGDGHPNEAACTAPPTEVRPQSAKETARVPTSRSRTVQVHLRLPGPDAELLRRLALERDQTISAIVRLLLKPLHAAARRADTSVPRRESGTGWYQTP